MKRGNIIRVITVLLAIAASACALTSCGGLDNEIVIDGLPSSYENMETAENMSAYALYCEAHAAYLDEDDYKLTRYYDFSTVSGVNQNMQIKTVRKISGGAVYNEEVVLGAGILSLNEGKKVYFKGGDAYSLYFNDKKKVPGTGEDVFAVSEWADFGAYDADRYGEAEKTERTFRTGMVSYDLSDPAYLSADSADTVYVHEGVYYFTLTVDCSDSAMAGVQRAVAEGIAEKTASKPEDMKMKSNTTIQAAVKSVDGKMKFTYLKINESYSGKLSFFNADCATMYYNILEYGAEASAITAAEMRNLANA